MHWFLFGGDMLVMLFMTILVVWVSMHSTQELLDFSARIPVDEESTDD